MPFIRACERCGFQNRVPAEHLDDNGRCGERYAEQSCWCRNLSAAGVAELAGDFGEVRRKIQQAPCDGRCMSLSFLVAGARKATWMYFKIKML